MYNIDDDFGNGFLPCVELGMPTRRRAPTRGPERAQRGRGEGAAGEQRGRSAGTAAWGPGEVVQWTPMHLPLLEPSSETLLGYMYTINADSANGILRFILNV